jgi:hypothetical protein
MANVSKNIIQVCQDTLRCPLNTIGNSRTWTQDPNTCQHTSKALLMPLGHDKSIYGHSKSLQGHTKRLLPASAYIHIDMHYAQRHCCMPMDQ